MGKTDSIGWRTISLRFISKYILYLFRVNSNHCWLWRVTEMPSQRGSLKTKHSDTQYLQSYQDDDSFPKDAACCQFVLKVLMNSTKAQSRCIQPHGCYRCVIVSSLDTPVGTPTSMARSSYRLQKAHRSRTRCNGLSAVPLAAMFLVMSMTA